MVARKAIPDEDHVSRFAPYSRQFRDPETDELIGLAAAACAIREQEIACQAKPTVVRNRMG